MPLKAHACFFFLQAEKSKIWRIQSPSKKSIGDVTSAFLRSFQLGASTQNRWSAQKKDCSEMLALQWEQLKKKKCYVDTGLYSFRLLGCELPLMETLHIMELDGSQLVVLKGPKKLFKVHLKNTRSSMSFKGPFFIIAVTAPF